ncbi:MAG: heavy metal-responsive transcriptional regulator [Acidobacteriota bacterium]
MPQGLQIGKLARETGLSVDTIRFYQKQGLLKESRRSEGGFRLFSPDDLETLIFIRKAQQLGFSLVEIRELLIVRDRKTQACSHVRDLLGQKLAAVEKKIQELREFERELQVALRKCNREIRKETAAHEECCPVLEEIGRINKNQEK